MRSRTLQEGSLGLFVILGLGLLGVLVLWLRGVSLRQQNYEFTIEFEDAIGMQSGAPVRYRGVTVGRLLEIVPGVNGVDARVEISSAELKIPRPQRIEANQGGLIAETTIDIVPPTQAVPDPSALASPVSSACNSEKIICQGDRLPGQVGISFEELMRSSTDFTQAFADPEIVVELKSLLESTTQASEEIAQLARDMSTLSVFFQEEIGMLSDSALATTQTVGQLARQFEGTAQEMQRLTRTANESLETNHVTLAATLDNVNQLSLQLNRAAAGLAPLLQRSDRTLALANENLSRFSESAVLSDLETLMDNATVLSANAAAASANLRQMSDAINDPSTIVLLQQTLDSARSTFQNVEKITSDLDDLTGDPAFRENLRRIINGLSGLVSLTEELERETRLAQTLAPLELSPPGEIEEGERVLRPRDLEPSPDLPKLRSLEMRSELDKSHREQLKD
ncbi:MlaD family protein [Baaleninema sp.]|uniref:MlaD family protein n=1 Tax=Baaleninema sp. TaxID=3101197 RepID=UPI003D08B845